MSLQPSSSRTREIVWPSVITAVFFTAGVTNIMLGLIGIYLGDLIERSRGRPRYVVQSFAGDLNTSAIKKVKSLTEKQRDT